VVNPTAPVPPKKRKKPLDLHAFLTRVKTAAFEIAFTIVFFVWLFRAVAHEIAR
jgi:hypothetical protein